MCNCTAAAAGENTTFVGLGGACPVGDAAAGGGVVEAWKTQLGVERFCELCITDGCPSTCGGAYFGFYQGPTCTNEPVLSECRGAPGAHTSALPSYVECAPSTCPCPTCQPAVADAA